MPKTHMFYDNCSFKKITDKPRKAEKGEYILADKATGEILQVPGTTAKEYLIYEKVSNSQFIVTDMGSRKSIFDTKNKRIVLNLSKPYVSKPFLQALIKTTEDYHG